jgi:hypothetical protein
MNMSDLCEVLAESFPGMHPPLGRETTSKKKERRRPTGKPSQEESAADQITGGRALALPAGIKKKKKSNVACVHRLESSGNSSCAH